MEIEVNGLVYEIICEDSKTFQFMISVQGEPSYQLHCTVSRKTLESCKIIKVGDTVRVKGNLDGDSFVTKTSRKRLGANTFWLHEIEII